MKQPNQSYSKAGLWTIRVVQVILVLTVLFAPLMIWALIRGDQEPSSYQIDQHGQDVGGERSAFKIYQDKLLVAVPSGGYYPLAQADISTIRLLSNDYSARHIAVDKNHLYCGNHTIAELNPATSKVIGQDYLTDGKYSYYCAPMTEPNSNLSAVQEVWQEVLYTLGLGDKPLGYWHPIVKLNHTNVPYKITLDGIASNGSSTYYQGQLMPQANADALYYIAERANRRSLARVSEHYSSDGEQVYFDQRLLDLTSNPDLLSIRFGIRDHYLFDPKARNFYLEDLEFPATNTPYKMLNPSDDHAYHALFLSPKGIFFYHKRNQKIERAGDNPFQSKLIQLAPDVYSDGKDTYFLSLARKTVHSRRGRRLCWFATNLNRIENAPPESWQKLADVKYDIWQKGTLWRNQDRIYYFDELGQGQLFKSAVYQVMDAPSVQLLHGSVRDDDIRRMIYDEKLIIPKTKDPIQAKEEVRFCLSFGELFD